MPATLCISACAALLKASVGLDQACALGCRQAGAAREGQDLGQVESLLQQALASLQAAVGLDASHPVTLVRMPLI